MKRLIRWAKRKYTIYRYTKWYNEMEPQYEENPEFFREFIDRVDGYTDKNDFEKFLVSWGRIWLDNQGNPVKIEEERRKLLKETYDIRTNNKEN